MMTRARSALQKSVAIACALLLPVVFGQTPSVGPPSEAVQQAPLLSPDQLDNLVAPIALYPDPLLGQVLAASTYPLEVVEAQQWLQENRNLQPAQLMDAARQQNWDPSVQALVAFPDALDLLGRDVRWTTDLGNAFLAQQPDVMNAIQRMRARASANGRLNTTAQQVVTTSTQNGQSAIEIQPADPQVVYVPVYNPVYVWGPPVWGAYPPLWYPGFSFGFGFGPGIFIGGFFPSFVSWGGWGWGCGWFTNALFVNTVFFNHYGFHHWDGFHGGFGGRSYGGHEAWVHDPGHRMGVSYPNRAVANQFTSGANANRFNAGRFQNAGRSNGTRFSNSQVAGSQPNTFRGSATGTNRFGTTNFSDRARVPSVGQSTTRGFTSSSAASARGFAGSNRSTAPGYRPLGTQRSVTPSQSYRSFSSAPASRGITPSARSFSSRSFSSAPRQNFAASPRQSFSAPSRSFSAPRQSYSAPRQSFSAPRQSFSAPSRSFSAPRQGFSAPRQSFSAPRQSFSAPRASSAPRVSGGGRSFGGGSMRSSGGGGRSSGGGGGRRR